MIVSGLIKSSLIDYPGKIAAVVFTQGCNFRCGFCHNPDLIPVGKAGVMSEADLFDFLGSRAGKLDGVVITGGEPTIQSDLVDFIKKIKALGYFVKLDSNGSNPKIIENLLSQELIDYVAMDIKNSPEKYKETSGYADLENIKKSIELIINSGVDYEFRTTVLPRYHNSNDFKENGKLISGAKRYVIQGFRSNVVYDDSLSDAKSFTTQELNEFQLIMQNYVKEVSVRNNQ